MAVKIVRQPNQIALIGAPSSAGAHNAGMEKSPAALRAAGLAEKLRDAGFVVNDLGDIPAQTWQLDEESPRMRNIPTVLAALNALRPLVEVAAKSGALPMILGGECTMALGTIAGLRRYYRNVNLIWLDSDADLNTPTTTPSGCLHGMVLAHIAGHGAPELVRFWSEPPLVREPDIALVGVARLDQPEDLFLARSPMKRMKAAEFLRLGADAAAQNVLTRMHTESRDFILHFDVDFISAEDMPAVDFPGTSGIRLEQARTFLEAIIRQRHLLAIDVASYNADKDPDGASARVIVDLLVAALTARLQHLSAPPPAPAEAPAKTPVTAEPAEVVATATEESQELSVEESPAAGDSPETPTETSTTEPQIESASAGAGENSGATSGE